MALLQTIALTKRFGDFIAVNSVNFTVNKGEFLSLVGSNGAGKTTLVNLISGQLSPKMGGPGYALFRFKDDHSPVYDHTALEKALDPATFRRTAWPL